MTREEMLERLHGLSFGANATVATMDMGLEYNYVSSEGAGIGFGGMGAWPLYVFSPISSAKLQAICDKLNDEKLEPIDLKDTDLELLYKSIQDKDIDLNKIFGDLCNFPKGGDGQIYCMCDVSTWQPEAEFFTSRKELLDAFKNRYCCYDIKAWDEMSNDMLESWLEQIEEYNLYEIPIISYADKDDAG